jgi:hypothetical protein
MPDTHVWVTQKIDGQPRYAHVLERSLRIREVAGWKRVAESAVPAEVRDPRRRGRPAKPAPAPDVAAPRRHSSPAPSPVEEN